MTRVAYIQADEATDYFNASEFVLDAAKKCGFTTPEDLVCLATILENVEARDLHEFFGRKVSEQSICQVDLGDSESGKAGRN